MPCSDATEVGSSFEDQVAEAAGRVRLQVTHAQSLMREACGGENVAGPSKDVRMKLMMELYDRISDEMTSLPTFEVEV